MEVTGAASRRGRPGAARAAGGPRARRRCWRDRLDQAVVRQLVPGQAAAFLGADEPGVDQRGDRPAGQALLGRRRRPGPGRACPAGVISRCSHQSRTRRSDRSAPRRGSAATPCGVEAGQRRVDVARLAAAPGPRRSGRRRDASPRGDSRRPGAAPARRTAPAPRRPARRGGPSVCGGRRPASPRPPVIGAGVSRGRADDRLARLPPGRAGRAGTWVSNPRGMSLR